MSRLFKNELGYRSTRQEGKQDKDSLCYLANFEVTGHDSRMKKPRKNRATLFERTNEVPIGMHVK